MCLGRNKFYIIYCFFYVFFCIYTLLFIFECFLIKFFIIISEDSNFGRGTLNLLLLYFIMLQLVVDHWLCAGICLTSVPDNLLNEIITIDTVE